jgi:hypothetical protein
VGASDVELEKGTGPEQLPQGAVSELNAATPSPTELAPEELSVAPGAQEEAVEEPLPAEAADYEPMFEPGSEDEAFLVSPTTRPDEAQTVGIPTGAAAIAPEVIRSLDTLQRAAEEPGAEEPGADPNLQTLVRLILRELGK